MEPILPLYAKRQYLVCIGGRQKGLPEDCGGTWAFMHQEQELSPYQLVEGIRELVDADENDMDDYGVQLEPYP